MLRFPLGVLSVLFLAATPVSGQTPVRASGSAAQPSIVLPAPGAGARVLTPDEVKALIQSGAGKNPQNPQNPQAPQQPAPPSQKLQGLQRLTYDRRPSSILKAWSTPEPEPVPVPKELEGHLEETPVPGTPPQADQVPAVEVKQEATASPVAPVTETPPETSAPAVATPGTGTVPPTQPTPAQPTPAQPVPQPAMTPEMQQREALKQAHLAKVLARDLQVFQRNVILSRWDQVKAFLGTLPEPERKTAYEALLRKLAEPPRQQNQPQNQQVPMHLREKPQFEFADILGLAAVAPEAITKEQVVLLLPFAQMALAEGRVIDELIRLLIAEAAKPEPVLPARRGAQLLSGMGRDKDLGPLLPTVEQAMADGDREGLNMLARMSLALHADGSSNEQLEQAWTLTQAALAAGEIDEADKAEALKRAVELAPKVESELGLGWLQESFTSRPERGMEILATIGSEVAGGFESYARAPDFRFKLLTLQRTAVEALLRLAPERAEEWRPTLAMLARHWMAEAAYSYQNSAADSLHPMPQRDMYGNYFYMGSGFRGQQQFVQPIEPGLVLSVQPSGLWVDMLDEALRPRFSMQLAQLYLKLNDEEKAFPYLSELAKEHPQSAKELCDEFLRVWIRNHDPNSERNRTNRYMFMYGFNQQASGIPLTRSKQDRNLAELAQWVNKLRGLGLPDLNEDLLVEAFTKSHSVAEVYRLETIQEVFGDLAKLKPRTLGTMLQTMRGNLVSVWRRPDVQENAKTRRKQKDIEREVLAGYETANALVTDAIDRHPGHFSLMTAKAALNHDENNFRQEVAKSADFLARRLDALAQFEEAAKTYASSLKSDQAGPETTEPFDFWFFASLGASDLGAVTDLTQPIESQPARIRAVMESLPEEARKRHMATFANQLFNRMSAVNAAVKFRYLKAGFEIVGDHPSAAEAKKVFDYYSDLVTEIRLETSIDGDAVVGMQEPFGLKIDLRHTFQIERESGGFSKYLQNQANQRYAYNYGRPTENYRDKFEEAARLALQEHFEILSLTFNSDGASSKATEQYGWRRTPYAYALLKPRGPQVDRIPQLRLDLDFLDTSGYVVLPVSSPVLPIDASREPGGLRPVRDLEVTQILDERKAQEGKLVLEIKAAGLGLVPPVDQLLALGPRDFDILKMEDQGVSVTKFSDDQEGVESERTVIVTMEAKKGLRELPRSFQFAQAKVDGIKMVHQRYVDADLVGAGPVVSLVERYDTGGMSWPAIVFALLLVMACGFLLFLSRRSLRPEPVAAGLELPKSITPFTVLAFLREIELRPGLSAAGRAEITSAIAAIEQAYFVDGSGTGVDLHKIAEAWLQRAG